MKYGVSVSTDYRGVNGLMAECVVIRDMLSVPKGRILAIIPREDKYEAEHIALRICDLLNKEETKNV